MPHAFHNTYFCDSKWKLLIHVSVKPNYCVVDVGYYLFHTRFHPWRQGLFRLIKLTYHIEMSENCCARNIRGHSCRYNPRLSAVHKDCPTLGLICGLRVCGVTWFWYFDEIVGHVIFRRSRRYARQIYFCINNWAISFIVEDIHRERKTNSSSHCEVAVFCSSVSLSENKNKHIEADNLFRATLCPFRHASHHFHHS